MPIYEYQCPVCKHQFEIMQKMSEAALTQCPSCQAESLQKIISSTQFQLKGTGWYATDFKNKNTKPKTEESVDKDKKIEGTE